MKDCSDCCLKSSIGSRMGVDGCLKATSVDRLVVGEASGGTETEADSRHRRKVNRASSSHGCAGWWGNHSNLSAESCDTQAQHYPR